MTQPNTWALNKERFLSAHFFMLMASAAIGFFLSLILIHFFLLNEDRQDFYVQLEKISQTNQVLYKEIESALTQSKAKNNTLCSHENLDTMRRNLWDKKYLKDIAHIENNHITCSANWGVFSYPIPLPSSGNPIGKGVEHWRSIRDPITEKKTINMTKVHETLVLIKNEVFQPYKNQKVTGIALELRGLPYSFRYDGNTSASALSKAKMGLTLTTITKQSCVAEHKICVVVQNNKLGLLGISFTSLVLVVLLSLLVGLTLSYTIHLHRAKRRSILHHLKKAISNESIYIRFQPKICLTTRCIVGVEALARWHDSNFGQVPPDVFIELAEKNNLIKKLSRVVIKHSINDFSALMIQHPNLTLSINLSMKDLTDPSLLDYINEQVRLNNITHEQLIFEITERTNEGFELIAKSVRRLTEVGYKVSLDDFGTGYANLSWLSKIQPHEIKVDKTFTQSIGTDSINQNMLNAIFVLLKEININVVFEGIETQEQMDYLLSRSNIAIGQGWLFARPISISALSKYIEDHQPVKHLLDQNQNQNQNQDNMAYLTS